MLATTLMGGNCCKPELNEVNTGRPPPMIHHVKQPVSSVEQKRMVTIPIQVTSTCSSDSSDMWPFNFEDHAEEETTSSLTISSD